MLPFINSYITLGVLSIMENEVVNRLNKVSESIVYKNEKLKAMKERSFIKSKLLMSLPKVSKGKRK